MVQALISLLIVFVSILAITTPILSILAIYEVRERNKRRYYARRRALKHLHN